MTLSIAARCARTGQIGTAVTSSSIAVAARCAWLRSGVGAVMTQNITDPALGPLLLDRLAAGETPQAALDEVVRTTAAITYRQLTVIDMSGQTADYSGDMTLGVNASADGKNCVAAGILLANDGVPAAMVATFTGSDASLPLAERLMLSLEAGMFAGGEAGPVHSAGLKVCGDPVWPIVDLRVDWAENEGVTALRSLWNAYEPQMQDYIIRAGDPASAPAYGVPGDDG